MVCRCVQRGEDKRSPAVFENKQDVISEGVSVFLQDSSHVIQHLHRCDRENTSQQTDKMFERKIYKQM